MAFQLSFLPFSGGIPHKFENKVLDTDSSSYLGEEMENKGKISKESGLYESSFQFLL